MRRPDNDRRRPGPGAASSVTVAGDRPSLRAVTTELTHLQRQVIVEAFNSAWPIYWERRARQLEAARPMPGDHHGDAIRDELSARWRSLTEAAAACRARGRMPELMAADVEADLDLILGEAS